MSSEAAASVRWVLRRLANSSGIAHASRGLIAVEMICILVPVTLLLFVFISLSLPTRWLNDLGVAMQLLLCVASCACGWTLAIALLFHGRVQLARQATPIWSCASLGAMLALAGLAAAVLPRSMFETLNQLANALRPFSLGSPLLLPFAHLLFERKLALLESEAFVDPTP